MEPANVYPFEPDALVPPFGEACAAALPARSILACIGAKDDAALDRVALRGGPGEAHLAPLTYRAGVFEAPYLAQIAMVRADSWTGAHFYTRSRRLIKISLQIARLWGAT